METKKYTIEQLISLWRDGKRGQVTSEMVGDLILTEHGIVYKNLNFPAELVDGVIINTFEFVEQPVPFLEAVKAYSEGKTIRCEVDGKPTQKYIAPLGRYQWKEIHTTNNTGISALEILEGKWFVEE